MHLNCGDSNESEKTTTTTTTLQNKFQHLLVYSFHLSSFSLLFNSPHMIGDEHQTQWIHAVKCIESCIACCTCAMRCFRRSSISHKLLFRFGWAIYEKWTSFSGVVMCNFNKQCMIWCIELRWLNIGNMIRKKIKNQETRTRKSTKRKKQRIDFS